ncbi:MAG: FHA domain-containing protein [Armatimonadetes bacterium]|nr:FHA domain-containing protein [Armatimonadota bacterium]NIM23793.1 FHA domain-containing protein [Armatimonadota bacterium]NIM67670.1 FHA domain-containing protein [Armatimonadota bacterium]NIM76186.1 FHA domain-containing protein [Armatimonadota bacterium]NIN05871.1 FHA domain-containing protein [Armatimonadota bacterium]
MPRCPACGAERESQAPCKQCGFEDLAAEHTRASEEVDDETLILHLLETPTTRTRGADAAKIWLLDPSGGEVEQASVLEEETTTIGRSHNCQIMLPSNTVSRQHAQIRREGERFLLKDLGSTNGTLLNSEPVIGEEVLKDRDEIGIGIYRLIFRYT